MRVEQSKRAWWLPAVALLVAAGVPSTAAGQSTVAPIAIPTGTNTYNNVIPQTVQLPAALAGFQNPLGLTPGFYSIDLGRCLGPLSTATCSGAFLTHAASPASTAGVRVDVDPIATAKETFGEFLGGGSSGDVPAVSATTMAGWSLFAMNVGPAQQAFSVADFASSIEMPLSQRFPNGNFLLPDWRNHSFSRSADYQEFSVAFPMIVDGYGNPPSQRLTSLTMRATNINNRVSWESTALTASSLTWATGLGTVTPNDLSFGFGDPPPPMTDAQKLERLLASISLHLLTDEPDQVRETWLAFNPLGMVTHDDWRRIADDIKKELPDLQAGKQSNLLNPDGTFTLPVRANLNTFVLPEPTAVPEPSTLALVGLGIAALALSRRRRR